MKKLLLTALLGVALGAGAWKAQNPEGTIDDFRMQAASTLERVGTGVNAGIQSVRDTGSMDAQALQQKQAQEQQLNERIATMEQALVALDSGADDSLTDSLESMDATIEQLKVSLQEAEAGNQASIVRLDAIDSRLELLVRRLDEQTVDTDLEALGENLAAVDEQLQELREATDRRNAALSNELADVSESTAGVALRLDTLSATATPSTAVSDGTEQSDDGTDQVALASLASGIDERFKALESRLGTVNSDSRRIAALSEQLEAAQAQISELQEQNASLQSSLAQVDASVNDLKTAGESLSIDTIQTEIRDQLALVQSQFESNAAADNTAALETLLESTREQISNLEQRVQDLPAASSEADAAQETQTALESQIVALEQRLEAMNSTDPELADTLSDVQNKVDQLASKEFVTQEDLRARAETRAVEYKIYFDRNSSEITDDAATVLDSFITQEKNRTTGVSIFGFTDRRGSATYNQQLALQRASNVRSYLIQNGLDFKKIKALNGLGEDAAAAVLPDNADDAQQRVVILYAAQP